MLIKVCGLAEPESIRQIAGLHPDMMGFIFYPQSPRNACNLSPDVVKNISDDIEKVGVFVNGTVKQIYNTARHYGLTTIQLHGTESPEFCRELFDSGLKIMKAIGISEDFDHESLRNYEGAIDTFVFDTATVAHGGSGKKFDWSLLLDYNLSTPFLLSGGIGPEDTPAIQHAMKLLPKMAGVDINSKFEIRPGHKSYCLIKSFMETINKQSE